MIGPVLSCNNTELLLSSTVKFAGSHDMLQTKRRCAEQGGGHEDPGKEK